MANAYFLFGIIFEPNNLFVMGVGGFHLYSHKALEIALYFRNKIK